MHARSRQDKMPIKNAHKPERGVYCISKISGQYHERQHMHAYRSKQNTHRVSQSRRGKRTKSKKHIHAAAQVRNRMRKTYNGPAEVEGSQTQRQHKKNDAAEKTRAAAADGWAGVIALQRAHIRYAQISNPHTDREEGFGGCNRRSACSRGLMV